MNTKIYNKDVGSINKIDNYLKPELVYIPLEDENNNTYEYIVKEGEYIYKGDIVAINKDNNYKMYSSVSGYALYGSNKLIKTGKKVKCIVIENDYKEKVRKNNKLTNNTKEELIKIFNTNEIKLIKDYINKSTNLLIINISNNNYNNEIIINNYIEQLLEVVDKITKILEIPKIILLVNNNYINSIKKINNYIKSYPNIKMKITNYIYLQGTEKKLLKKEFNISNKLLISNINEIYEINELLKNNIPISEKIISIKGNAILNNKTLKVKIGSLASEIINYIGGYKNIKEPLLIAGDLLKGHSVNTDDLIITKNIDTIFITNNNYEKTSKCINCGKCIEVCPSKISPISILEGNRKKIDKCTECGLCSFICPSKIEVLEAIKAIKEKENI